MSRPSSFVAKHIKRSTEPKAKRSAADVRYIAIGRIVKPHGIRGEISMVVLTEFPERFATTELVYLGDEYEADPHRLIGYRWHKSNLLITLDGIESRDDAETLRGLYVQVPLNEAVPLPEGSYYIYQIVGLDVVTTTGEHLGVLDHILETGANDVYVVKNGKREVLLPCIPDVVHEIDLEKRQIIVQMLEGLI